MAKVQGRSIDRRTLLKTAGAVGASLATSRVYSARAQGKKLEDMSVFIGTTPHFGNVIIGAEKGFYKKEGLNATITNFASGATAVDAFRAGRGNLVVAGDLPSLRLWKQGGIGIAPQSNYGDLSIIVAKKSITKPADLKGKKVGVLIGSTSEYFTKLYLASGNVDYKDIDVINLRPAEMVTGLVRGDISAFVIWQPFGWRALAADPDAHIVTVAAPFFHEWEMVSTTTQYAATHKEELVAFLRGLDAAGKWIVNNEDEAARIIGKGLRMDDTKLVKDMITKIDWSIAYTKPFQADMDRLGQFLNLHIDWKTMFDPKFLAELGPAYVKV